MGDFNINLLKIDINESYNSFYNSLSHFFTPFILQPTRLQSKTSIDNIFFSSVEYQSNSANLLIEISDHIIQFLINERNLSDINLFGQDFSNFNQREFYEEVMRSYEIHWIHLTSSR